MPTVATLKLVEDANAGTTYSIASIPLNKLVPWDGNVRKTGASDGLEELIASIEANGLLQSLVVRKANRGKYSIIAGRRRFLALSALAGSEKIAHDAPVPCRVVPGSADPREISLTENVVRAPMHPADQFVAFRDLIDGGSTPAEIAARFGISETVVSKRMKLARVSPVIFEAYRAGDLKLEQVQAFAVSDDHAAQEQLFGELDDFECSPNAIRRALTKDEIAATDKRARFATLEEYENAGGSVRRDLFCEGEEGIFLLDSELLDRLTLEKLRATAETVVAEGWKWVEAYPEFNYDARSRFQHRHPEPLPLSGEAEAERKASSEEYERLFDTREEDDEETSERLDEIEERITELEDTEQAYTPDTFAIAGAVVTIGRNGEPEIVRGLVRGEDEPEQEVNEESSPKDRPRFSASLVESLTAAKSAAISASLCESPGIALAAVVYIFATEVIRTHILGGSMELSLKRLRFRESSVGADALDRAHEEWERLLPAEPNALWQWCLAQDQETLLKLLAFCAARSLDAVQRKGERPDSPRLAHANAVAEALSLDMKAWFSPDAANYFSRVGRTEIFAALTEGKGLSAKRSWEKLKKSELALLAEREIAGTGWLPEPIRA